MLQGGNILFRIFKGAVGNAGNGGDVGANADALGGECRTKNGTYGNDGGGDAPRKMTAAAKVLISVIFAKGGIIGVGGARDSGAVSVIGAPCAMWWAAIFSTSCSSWVWHR